MITLNHPLSWTQWVLVTDPVSIFQQQIFVRLFLVSKGQFNSIKNKSKSNNNHNNNNNNNNNNNDNNNNRDRTDFSICGEIRP